MTRRKDKPLVINSDTAVLAPVCPSCSTAIALQATVEQFLVPPEWHFWGTGGQRWRLCTGRHGRYDYIHFKTIINNQTTHRLAWITPAVVEENVQGQLI